MLVIIYSLLQMCKTKRPGSTRIVLEVHGRILLYCILHLFQCSQYSCFTYPWQLPNFRYIMPSKVIWMSSHFRHLSYAVPGPVRLKVLLEIVEAPKQVQAFFPDQAI